MKPQEYLSTAKKLQAERKWEEAEAVLAEASRKHPNHPDINTAYGLALCFSARETQAMHHVEASGGDELVLTLLRHFHLKEQADRRLGITDLDTKDALALLKELAAERCIQVGELPELRLSACLIVRNEQANLPDCLVSIMGLADEIVVVDTGSTDDTVDVAVAYGAKIGVFEWCDDFAAARNASLELATGTWALWIDADERLSARSQTAFLSAMIRPHFGGYTIPIINYLSEDLQRDKLEHRPCRLFQLRPEIRFEGKIHEQITPSIERLGLPIAQLEGVHIEHYGYLKSQVTHRDKLERTISMLRVELQENPNDAFQLFNLGNAHFTDGNYAEAIAAFQKASGDTCGNFGQYMRFLWAFALYHVRRYDEAIEVCENAYRGGDGGVLIDYAKACILAEMGRLEEALETITSSFGKRLEPDEPGDRAIEQWKSKALAVAILIALNRIGEAEELARKTYFEHRENRELWLTWIQAAQKCEDPQKLVDAFEAGASFEFDADLLVMAGQAFEKVGRIQNAMECYEQAISLDVEHANAFFSAGDLLLKNGHPYEAAQAYQKGLMIRPEHAEGWFMLGNAMYRAGSIPGAAIAYRQAIDLDPTHERAKVNLEMIFEPDEKKAA